MRILITGGSSFIGRHIVPLLIKDTHELLILSRKNFPITNGQTVIGDLKNLNQIKKSIIDFDPQVCLHLAWEGIPDFSYEQSKSNFDCSINLIQMLVRETSCRKIIVSGSSWEYGNVQGVCREDDQAKSTSYFIWAKNAIYSCGSLLCSDRDIDFVWLRLFFAFGPGQRKHALIPMLYNAFKNGQAPNIKNPYNAQDFIDVRDIAEAFRLCVEKSIQSGIYNIGREEPISVSDIYSIVERQMLKKPLGLNSNISTTKVSTAVRNWADTSKFRRATAWLPKISVQEGIKNHIEFLENK